MSEVFFVRSKSKSGFRRAGEFFPAEGKNIDSVNFSKFQLDQINAEPMLIVAGAGDTPDEIIEDIVEAIEMLEPEKKPNVKDLENIVSKKITAAQRDAAWDVYQDRVKEG